MSSKPDWSKAPEGATHWCDESDTDCARWLRRNKDGSWDFMLPGHDAWAEAIVDDNTMRTTTPRPAAWDGTGLPPVGIECERCWDSLDRLYHRVKILAHDDGAAVYRWLDGKDAGSLQADEQRIVGNNVPIFRPISADSPAQFAIGDRVKKVTGDYQITGEVRSVFTKANGETRLVVEHNAEGGGSFLHIYGPNNLEKIA